MRSTNATCASFPKSFVNLSYLYTVNADPQRPDCIWVNADGGSGQIQNLDAYTGGSCGQGPIRVLASSMVVPTQLCMPATYTSLQVTSPAPGTYTSGTVQFLETLDTATEWQACKTLLRGAVPAPLIGLS